LTALTAEFTVGEGKLMTHDEPCSMAPDDKHDLISGTCSHLPKVCRILTNPKTYQIDPLFFLVHRRESMACGTHLFC
ncbi:hypothetical protein, partial [Aeromonas media]|uniref:hypothetical protein n=1 Tax=Aeromonas media TaxID=651 RepID=UPI001B6F1651|nr:hypothetical protein [Aeromonas sp.]MBP8223531.1 hypothetical protein [Aeromonas sp.]